MSKDKNREYLAAAQALAAKDLEEASDEQIRAEFIEDGLDPDQVARQVSESLDEVVASFMRTQAAAKKAAMSAPARSAPKARPALERIKELVQAAFTQNPSLAAAFRDGKKQSENDLLSLYDDLVALGKIKEGDAD